MKVEGPSLRIGIHGIKHCKNWFAENPRFDHRARVDAHHTIGMGQ
jgi:hypothetical protein